MTDVASVLTKKMAGVEEITCTSIECVDNAKEFPGVIVYDDKTFPNPSQQVDGVNVVVNNTLPQQETGFGAKHGTHSFARPFKLPLFRLDEECDQPDLK